ncbi:GAP family protein [Synechococcus sp. ATX 2A4]|uniref:GAP family protein n=1 Tax=Synechococcus sp. ATX 2A4 TaxID=2823727 RepID=UPI0020CF73CE|nr:GAP family protein [Synechococcus sp. ATX 2A4]
MPAGAVLAAVLPLAAGAAMSPLVLVLQVRQLLAPARGLARAWAFLLGTAVITLVWLGLGLAAGDLLPPRATGPDPVAATLHLAVAALLVSLGAANLLRAAPGLAVAPPPPSSVRAASPWSAFRLGLGAMAANLSSLALFLPAVQDLARSSLGAADRVGLSALLVGFTLLPALLPPCLVLASGRRGEQMLERVGRWLNSHQRQVSAVLCFLFAALLTINGLARL